MEAEREIRAAPAEPWLTIVGIGEDGMAGLSPAARAAVEAADVIVGAERHHHLSDRVTATRLTWPHPFDALIETLRAHRRRRIVVLATGDPLWFSVGARIGKAIPPAEIVYHPQLSAFQWAACRLGWSLADAETLTAHGRPAAGLIPQFWPGARLLILTAGPDTPLEVARLLDERGYGASRMIVLGNLGGPDEIRIEATAADWAPFAPDGPVPTKPDILDGAPRPGPRPGAPDLPAFHTLAVEVAGRPARLMPRVPGLPDEAFVHDGQITKREVRALTLARLMPARGETLWDIGAGAGSVAVEWMRAAPDALAVAVERDPARAALARANAAALGTPKLAVIEGEAPGVLADLSAPDAVFVGGGLCEAVVEAALRRLRPLGRLVANAVTLESEALLIRLHARLGGDLTRISVARAQPIGGLTGWRPAMPVTQWSLER